MNDKVYEAIGTARYELAYLFGYLQAAAEAGRKVEARDIFPRVEAALDAARTAHRAVI